MSPGKEEYVSPEDVPPDQAKSTLDFLNSARTPGEVADAVEFPGERDVGPKVARNILDERDRLGGFKELGQVYSVRQVGPERFTEIVRALGKGIVLRQRKPHWELRRTLVDRMVGTADRARLLRDVLHARHHRAGMYELERTAGDLDTSFKGFEVVGGPGDAIQCEPVESPTGRATFGSTDLFMNIQSKHAFSAATLRFMLDRKSVSHLDTDTILVARWDEQARRFRVIPQSGYNAGLKHAFARITRPGIYTAIGIPKDPRIRTTLQLMASLRDWDGLAEKFNFNEKICQLILCSPEMEGLVKDFVKTGQGLDQLGFAPSDFQVDYNGRDLCEMCIGLGGLDGLVEIDIMDTLNVPSIIIKPWPLPLIWPRFCPGWVSIGPDNVPGRIGALAIHPSDGNTVYAGAAAGGVFKTANGGANWYAKWSEQLSLAIGGLAVAPSNPDIIYAATGEWEGNVGAANNHFPGVGVYRSTNGGVDWDLLAPFLGPNPSQNTAAVAVDPTDPNRVFVAGDTSLNRTPDGGASWDVTPGNVNGIFDGIISDVIIDPNDPNRLYLGVHNSGVWRSTDGGATWTQLTFPAGANPNSPKIALGRNGTNGTQFVAVKMARQVYTSRDGGDTTFDRKTDCDIDWSPFYPWANVIAVDPDDQDVLFGGHASIYRSDDGGLTWTKVGGYPGSPWFGGVHPDQQALVFDPNDHNHVYLANDGGINESTDNGLSWTLKSNGLHTTQCWTVGVSQEPQLAYGITTQDNACYEWDGGLSFSRILRPEGGWIEYDPQSADVIYADTWYASLKKSTDGGANWNDLGIETDNGNSEALSIAWTNSNWLLAVKTNGRVARSTDGGNNWPETLNVPGVVISAVQFAPSDDNHAYAASTTGRVWHSTDGGNTWNELPNAGLPAARVHDIEVDWADPLRVFLAFGALGVRQLWRGEVDAANNATWFDAGGALPAVSLPDLALTGLALHPYYDETIYVSNILGVYRSTDGGESWAPFDEGLPNSFVSDLDIRKRDRTLYASTMGRGVYRRFV